MAGESTRSIWARFTSSYPYRFGTQVWRECISWSADQFVPLIIAAISAWMAIYFRLVPIPQTRAAYEAYLGPFGAALLLYLVVQIIRAPFVLDRERGEEVARLRTELDSARAKAEDIPIQKLLAASLNPARISQDRHTAALEGYTRQIERGDRRMASRVLHRPGPMIGVQEACESHQARLFIQNSGATGEFYGVFTVTGLTEAQPGETFYCKWQHTYSKRIKIPEGLGFWILLAERHTDSFGTTGWDISAVKESERGGRDKAVFINTTERSNETTTPIERAADVVIEGSIVANPDAVNGVRKFRVILKAFEAVFG